MVEALHVWHVPYVGVPGLSPPYPDEEVVAYETQVLDHAITAAGSDDAVDRRLVAGHPAHELIEAARRSDFVVVGSGGHGGVAGTLLRSVSQRVVVHAKRRVVVVRRPVH